MMKIGKHVTEDMSDGISMLIVDRVFYQKEQLLSWRCEENCDAILYDVVIDNMGPFEINNILNLNPFL